MLDKFALNKSTGKCGKHFKYFKTVVINLHFFYSLKIILQARWFGTERDKTAQSIHYPY